MRPSRVVLCCCAVLVLTEAVLAQEPPYEAVVVDDQVVARSGPGRQYYPTGKLPRGTKVRVLRHDYGGWYAVSPPEGSFSWVDSRYVEDQGDGMGVVKGDNVIVRIGSSAVNRSDMLAGVQLSSNQKVRILGSAVLDDKSGSRYYKIEPVRGEERWIAGRSVTPVGAEPVDSPSLTQPDHGEGGDWQSHALRRSEESQAARHKPLQKSEVADEDADEEDHPPIAPLAREDGAEVGADNGPALHGPARPEPSDPPQPDRSRASVPPDPAVTVLQDAHRRLAQIVGQNIATWDLQPAAELYRRALLQTRSPHVRFAARQGLERVERYAALKANYDGFQRAKARAEGRGSVADVGGPRLIASGEPVGRTAAPPEADVARPEAPHSASVPPERRTATVPTRTTPPRSMPQPSPSPRRSQIEPPDDRLAALGPVRLPQNAGATTAPASEPQPDRAPDLLPERQHASVAQARRGRRAVSLVSRVEELPGRAPRSRPAETKPSQVQPPSVPPRVASAGSAPAEVRTTPAENQRSDDHDSSLAPRAEGRYDGAGTLERTAMQGLQAPEYKLVDSSGRVRYYISPALGTDLRAYLRQSIAVVGQVQYRADLRAHHITVRQVIPLNAASDGQQAALPISTNTTTRRYY